MICILNTTLFEKTSTTGQRKKGKGMDNGSFPTENLVLASGKVTGNQQLELPIRSSPEECWGPPATEREMETEHTHGGQESRKGPQEAEGRGATNLQM